MKQYNNLTIFFSFFLAFLGFLDATYLSIVHFKHIIPPCTISGSNCEAVLTSQYATIFGIPVALIGAVYFLGLLVLLGMELQNKRDVRFKIQDSGILGSFLTSYILHPTSLLLLLTTLALLVSGILVYIQAGILHAFCQYCLGVETINLLLFLLIWFSKKSPSIR